MKTMLILRGIAAADKRFVDEAGVGKAWPRGALHETPALEYAKRRGFVGEVLDVRGNTGASSIQVVEALKRIRDASKNPVGAIYGFSGGAFNAVHIWRALKPAERAGITDVAILGAPEVDTLHGFFGTSVDRRLQRNPPKGHMWCPEALLELTPAPPVPTAVVRDEWKDAAGDSWLSVALHLLRVR